MLPCYNRGCGQTFDPAQNTDESCRHHPGEPYFHDVYKGWSCCKKKSVDFTEFLNIKGCTLSKHSNDKPPEPEKPQKNADDNKDEIIEVRAPIPKSMERPPIETPMTVIIPVVEESAKKIVDEMQSTNKTATEDTPEGIPIGTSCKNKGCTVSYKGANADNGECQYHPGAPIFHEGMKYWSCCQKKTTDFAVFMAQKGCAYGEHKWIKENDDKKAVQCRHDWHQTATDVIVSVYAKKYHYAQSKIQVNPIRLQIELVFPEQNEACYSLDIELRGVIDVKQTTAHMFSTKVEITMRKAEPGSWAKLDFPRQSKLPPPKSNVLTSRPIKSSESDDDFNLDDIDTVKPGGLTITEMNALD